LYASFTCPLSPFPTHTLSGSFTDACTSSTGFPASAPAFAAFHNSLKRQIKDAFDEIKQGKPRGDLTQ
jgi:hypothetical protein